MSHNFLYCVFDIEVTVTSGPQPAENYSGLTDDIEVTVTRGALPDYSSGLNPIGLSVGVVVVCVVFLFVFVAAVLLAMLVVRRIKGNVRTFQLERLTRLVTCMCTIYM